MNFLLLSLYSWFTLVLLFDPTFGLTLGWIFHIIFSSRIIEVLGMKFHYNFLFQKNKKFDHFRRLCSLPFLLCCSELNDTVVEAQLQTRQVPPLLPTGIAIERYLQAKNRLLILVFSSLNCNYFLGIR